MKYVRMYDVIYLRVNNTFLMSNLKLLKQKRVPFVEYYSDEFPQQYTHRWSPMQFIIFLQKLTNYSVLSTLSVTANRLQVT